MSYLTQKTIKNNVLFSGVALHSGLNANICIKPADPNFGIIFKRIDLKDNNVVYPNFMNVTNTSLNTTIENEYGDAASWFYGIPKAAADIFYSMPGFYQHWKSATDRVVREFRDGPPAIRQRIGGGF